MMATNTPPPRSAPITASSHDTAPVPRLASTPATIPGSVIAFGMIWSWRSMAVIAMSAARAGAASASARSITSPRREQRGPELPPHGGADHPEDPVRGVRGVELAGFEKDPDQPEPRLGGVELQLERVTKLLQRRLAVAEFGERVAEIRVGEDVLRLEPEGALNLDEGLVGPVQGHQRRRRVVQRVHVVRVPLEENRVLLDRLGEVPRSRFDEAEMVVGLHQIRSDLQRP